MGKVLSMTAFNFDYLYGYVSTAAWLGATEFSPMTGLIPSGQNIGQAAIPAWKSCLLCVLHAAAYKLKLNFTPKLDYENFFRCLRTSSGGVRRIRCLRP